MDKRTFLKNVGAGAITALPFTAFINNLSATSMPYSANELSQNEDFWVKIRADYFLKPDYINLEGGYYCMLPQPTLHRLMEHIKNINVEASFYMRTVQEENQKKASDLLADVAGCSPEELIITRNTTESLDMIIGGYPWQKGDEAIMANQDYYAMRLMFDQVAARYGVVKKMVDVPLHPKSDEEIVELYASAITSKTKLLMICHVINLSGQLLPVRKICDMAHAKGVEVMVDGAHAFAQLDFKVSDLNCDYYGTSLHKWFSVPMGSGFLYVRKGLSDKIWPLMAEAPTEPGDIMRLNHKGTYPVHMDLVMKDARDYHDAIGIQKKEARLRYIQRYWSDQVRQIDGVNLNTPEDPKRSCAIANVGIKGMKPKEMSKVLLDKYKIWTVAIDSAGIQGCRITPNVYTTTDELDTFVKAIKDMV
jgi:selenocysteine lyase/cysteine desulfurase